MIFVDRSKVPVPDVLLTPRVEEERERIRKLLGGSKEHVSQLRLGADARFIQPAKPFLLQLFRGKCAYCEAILTQRVPGDIEHFRPKQGASDLNDRNAQHDYYSWLSLEWDNLLIACANCNRRYKDQGRMVGKGPLFPLDGDRAPLLASVAECRSKEKTLLIDPCFDRPENELSFGSNGLCLPKTRRGEASLEILNLNRRELVVTRKYLWRKVGSLVGLVARRRELLPDAVAELRSFISGGVAHTAATRAAFAFALTRIKGPALREKLTLEAFADVDVESRNLVLPPRGARRKPAARAAKPPAPVKKQPVQGPPRRYGDKALLPPYAHQRLRRVVIRNFKAIESLEFDFPDAPNAEQGPATLLLGENSTGKSTMLEAIALTLLGTDLIKKLKLDPIDFIRRTDWEKPLRGAKPAEVEVYFTDEESPVRLTVDPKPLRFRGQRKPATIVLAYGPRRYFTEGRRRKPLPGLAEQVRTLFDPVAVIENPTRWLIHSKDTDFDAAVRALREVLLLADEEPVERPPKGQRRGKQITVRIQGEREPVPLNRLSEGYKTIVAMSVDVMRELLEYWPHLESARGVVLIDELETHLHPRWKMRIVNRLRRAMPNVQFIATTHDPLCLRGLFNGEVQVLQRDEEKRIEKLVEIPNVEGLSVEQLLTSEFFGLFSSEDPGLDEDVARYATLATKSNRTPEEDAALDHQREQVQSKITVGARPVDRLVNAATQVILEERRAPKGKRPPPKKETIDRVVSLWKSLKVENEAT